ncbi:hypothetical protein ACFFNY_14575 [Paenibacillus hodogayensis]|uniref:Uncharacterized protein n=1 Tax=Paenibacillus hodogayensis TaxID=279208 RepID=A0ABV5VX15_9BACL
MIEKYKLANEPDKTMFVFPALAGKVYGHIVKDRTEKGPAKLVFETSRYDSIEALKADYPEASS